MTLKDQMTRCPRIYDTQIAREAKDAVGDVGPEVLALISGTAGCSPYLAGLINKHTRWLPEAMEAPEQTLAAEIAAVAHLAPDELSSGLRVAKQRIALLTALADLSGAWRLEQVTAALTDFATAACDAAIKAGIALQLKRGKLPGVTEDDLEDAAGVCIFAMGKMGAGELNYSSDIDLICLFDETRHDPQNFFEIRQAFVRATRAMCASLSEITAQGYVFRTDLRLRPDPSVTPVCIAMEAAENYYESLGRTWERAAYIKARPAAGDKKAGERFLKTLTPFVWRRHLDFAAIQDAHDMRLAIRQHKGLGGSITLPGHNMKLGRGGIREIEFFTQTRQLIAGGRDSDLRCRGTIQGLDVLAQKGWVEPETARDLQDHYTAHRTVEHRLQMVQDAQTHSLPGSDEGFARLAAMMDMDVAPLQQDIKTRLEAVHAMTEGFFAPSTPQAKPQSSDFDEEILNRWLSYPALRSARSRDLFERVKPELLARLAQAARPQEALVAFDGFLSGLPAGVQLLSLLEANPQLGDLLIDITGASPSLAQYLSRNASVFDAVIGGDFFSEWPGQAGLETALKAALHGDTDYENRLDGTRRWHKEWHFRIGVHLLRGLIDTQTANAQYTDLARAVVVVLWPIVTEQFARKHGPPPGRGAAVLGMGSLGAGTINAGSDLDLIVIYDPLDHEASEGKKPLPSRLYYARLTQALITALTAPMAQGKLFEVDMRLRPSGNQGPVATSWSSFTAYQTEQAWVWEHLALTRAAIIAGPMELAHDISVFRDELLTSKRDITTVASEVAQMLLRIREAKPPQGLWDVKIGEGRLQEIELLAQAGALLSGRTEASTAQGLHAAGDVGLLSPEVVSELTQAAKLFSGVQTAVRLLSENLLDPEALGQIGQTFLLRTLKADSIEELEKRLAQSYTRNSERITAALAPYAPKGTSE